jgi:itaconyl-CoA hydratase
VSSEPRRDLEGRVLEEFAVGRRHDHGPGRTLHEAEHRLFCALTGSRNPVHHDPAAARAAGFDRPTLLGAFVFSVLCGLSAADVSAGAIANAGVDAVEFLAPVHAGDTLTASSVVEAVRPSRARPDRGVVVVSTEGRNQHGRLVCRFRRTLIVWRAGARPPAGRVAVAARG